MKRRPVDWTPLLIFSVVVVAAGLGLARLSGLSIWTALAIAAGAILANGLVATLEDDLPGGFTNPDGSATPPYVRIVSLIGRSAFVLALTACAAVFLLMASDAGWTTLRGMSMASFAAAAPFAFVAVVLKRRTGLWGLLVFVGAPIVALLVARSG